MQNIIETDYSELTKEIREKSINIKELLKVNWITEEVFTDKFLDIYSELEEKLYTLLSEKTERTNDNKIRSMDKLFEKTVKKAIDRIIELKENTENELEYSLFIPWNKKNLWKDLIWDLEIKETNKYNQF